MNIQDAVMTLRQHKHRGTDKWCWNGCDEKSQYVKDAVGGPTIFTGPEAIAIAKALVEQESAGDPFVMPNIRPADTRDLAKIEARIDRLAHSIPSDFATKKDLESLVRKILRDAVVVLPERKLPLM
jgi:hypothetical protein